MGDSFNFKNLLIAILLILLPFAIKIGDAKSEKYMKEGIQVEATVVSVENTSYTPRRPRYSYTVTYTNENGNKILADAILNTTAKVGDVLTVRYLRETPNKVFRAPSATLSSTIHIGSIISFIIGCLMIFFMFKKKGKKDHNDIDLDLHEIK